MGDVDEVQEHMKTDMVAVKDQMASMMEVMHEKTVRKQHGHDCRR